MSNSPSDDDHTGTRDAPLQSAAANDATNTTNTSQRRTGLSCAECRRSKLKCDRAIPCQACVRRGCAKICPDGTLTATKGNKVLQAKAQKLGEQVQTLTARVKQLEAALLEAQQGAGSRSAQSPPPNFQNREPEGQLQRLVESVGSLAITEEGGIKYHGSTSSSEYLSSLLPGDDSEKSTQKLRDPRYLGLPQDIINLTYAFPFGLQDCPYNTSIFSHFLPSRNSAHELLELYWLYAAWQFSPISRQDFYQNIFDAIYEHLKPTADFVRPHELAMFFAILGTGLIWSDREDPSSLYLRYQYYALARAAFSLAPIANSVTTTSSQALFCINRLLNNSCRTVHEECWLLHGVNSRIASIIGLQYDGSAFDLDEQELQRRRLTFWELYTWDVWNGFVMGRVPSMRLEFTDCRFPANDSGHGQVPGELGFHAWKYRYTATFLPATIRQAFNAGSTVYSSLIELDRKIRIYPLPTHLMLDLQKQDQHPWSLDPITALQQCACIFMKETNLLYLHRSYFAIAIEKDPTDPLSHQYGASVMSTYRSACRLCLTLKGLYLLHPKESSKIWYYWSQVFSACVALAALVLGAPSCSLAQEAMIELTSATAFFEEGSAPSRPAKTMQLLARLKQKARDFYANYRSNTNTPPDVHPSDRDAQEEFSILNGRNGVIRHKSDSQSDPSARHSYADPSSTLHSQSLFPEQLYSSHMGQGLSSMTRSSEGSSYSHALSSSSSSHDGSFGSSRPPSVHYQETLPNFHSFDTAPTQSEYSHTMGSVYGYNGMTDQMAYSQSNPALQSSNPPNDGLGRRDVWSSFIDRIMTDSTSQI